MYNLRLTLIIVLHISCILNLRFFFFYDYNSHVVVFGLDGVLRKNSALIKMPHIPAHPISAEDAEQFLRCELQNYNHILYRKFNINYSVHVVKKIINYYIVEPSVSYHAQNLKL